MPDTTPEAHITGSSYEQLLAAGAWAALREECFTNYVALKAIYEALDDGMHRFHTRALRAELYRRSGRTKGQVSAFYFMLWVAENSCKVHDPGHHNYDYTRK